MKQLTVFFFIYVSALLTIALTSPVENKNDPAHLKNLEIASNLQIVPVGSHVEEKYRSR